MQGLATGSHFSRGVRAIYSSISLRLFLSLAAVIVAAFRIYDKEGEIIFSADSTEIGRRVDLHAEACVSCHEAGTPLRAVPDRDRVRIFDGPQGRVMGVINAIENTRGCAKADCHAPPEEQ